MKKSLINQKGISGVLVAVIIAVILVVAAGAYFAMKNKNVSLATTTQSTAAKPSIDAMTKQTVPTGDTSSTFTDLVGRGQNLECDFTLPSSGDKPNPFGTGKLYTSGKMGRSMLSGNASGMAIDANAIYKEGIAYTWVTVGGTTTGFKFDKAKMDEMSSQMTPQQKMQGEQFRAKMDFKCKPWTPDESKFTLPIGVDFK